MSIGLLRRCSLHLGGHRYLQVYEGIKKVELRKNIKLEYCMDVRVPKVCLGMEKADTCVGDILVIFGWA